MIGPHVGSFESPLVGSVISGIFFKFYMFPLSVMAYIFTILKPFIFILFDCKTLCQMSVALKNESREITLNNLQPFFKLVFFLSNFDALLMEKCA